MTITANLADGRVLTFPDGTKPEVIQATVKRMIQQQPDQLRPTQAATPVEQDFIPTEEALAIPAPGSPERTLSEQLIGAGEAALTTATGATTGALGFGTGSLIGAAGELTGQFEGGEGLEFATSLGEKFTFQPRTEAGKDIVGDIAKIAAVIPPVIGTTSFGATSLKNRPSRLKSPKMKRLALAQEIEAGNINAGNIAKRLDASGKLVTNPNVKKAIQLMGNDDAAYSTAINFEKMTPATKSQINKMLDVIESNKSSGDPTQIMSNRPVDVIGQSLARRVNKLNDIKKAASKQIGDLVKGDLGNKQANVNRARNDFISSLNDADIGVGMVEGKLVADTTKTLTNVNEVVKLDKLNNILGRLQKGNIPAREAHKLKRNLREMVSFDPSAPGAVKVSAEIENAFKKLSADLGESVSKLDGRYKSANQKMAESLGALKEVDRQLGKQIMIGDDLAASKLGALSKRIGTNLASREQVISMVDDIDNALRKRGIRPKDDIKRQVAALADLEKIFKVEGEQSPFGFQARVAQGVADVAVGGQAGATRELLDAAVNRFRSMNKLEFKDKMKALRALSKVEK